MASIPPISRIIKEDFQQYPWAEKLLWPINRFFESVVSALNKNLTFTENMNAQVKALSFTTKTPVFDTFPLNFASTSISKPTDLWLTRLEHNLGQITTAPVTVDWIFENGLIKIRNITGLAPATSYIVRFILVSEAI